MRPKRADAADPAAAEASAPLCPCHREPMRKHGGRDRDAYRCAVKQREYDARYQAAHRDRKAAWERAKYDLDPIHRITKLEKHSRRRRLATLNRRKEGMRYGQVSLKGRNGSALESDPPPDHP